MVKSGVPEGIAIATADKTGDKLQRSPQSRDEHMSRRTKHATQAATGKEFGTSQSTVSRKVMKQGYSKGRM